MPFASSNRATTLHTGGAKPIYPTWARNYNTQGCGTWPSNDESGPSRYDQFVTAMTSDERFQREVTLGKRIGLYKFRGELGTGNFSRVKLAFHQLAHERVAVKIIEKTGMDQKALKMLSREIANMDTVRHPAIVRLFEVVETISKVYLVMEVASGGEMYTRITTEGRYDEPIACNLYSQLVSAVEYMHERDLYHRDIKAENVFLSSNDRIRLGDFGFSTQNNVEQLLTTFCGSPPYAAPELFHDDSYSGAAVDTWALGVLLYFMVTATMPFQAQTVAGLKLCILENAYSVPSYLSEPCVELIRAILRRDPAERTTLSGIRNSSWLQGQEQLEPTADNQFDPSPPEETKSSMEIKVSSRLEELGITQSMVWDHRDKGGRSAIIGTYRILMYRANADQVENNNNTAKSETEKQQQQQTQDTLLVPNSISQNSSSKSVRSNKSNRSKKSSIISSTPSSRRPSTVTVQPPTIDNSEQSEPMTTVLSVPSPPTKTKFKHKFNLSILGNKKNKGNSAEKSSKKKMSGSKTCTIL